MPPLLLQAYGPSSLHFQISIVCCLQQGIDSVQLRILFIKSFLGEGLQLYLKSIFRKSPISSQTMTPLQEGFKAYDRHQNLNIMPPRPWQRTPTGSKWLPTLLQTQNTDFSLRELWALLCWKLRLQTSNVSPVNSLNTGTTDHCWGRLFSGVLLCFRYICLTL